MLVAETASATAGPCALSSTATLAAAASTAPPSCEPMERESPAPPLRRESLRAVFESLTQQAGAVATERIFNAVCTTWEALSNLAEYCPRWASHTGGVGSKGDELTNTVFHKMAMQNSTSLTRLFTYYVCLSDITELIQKGPPPYLNRVVDALLCLEGIRLEQNPTYTPLSRDTLLNALPIAKPAKTPDPAGTLPIPENEEVNTLLGLLDQLRETLETPPSCHLPPKREDNSKLDAETEEDEDSGVSLFRGLLARQPPSPPPNSFYRFECRRSSSGSGSSSGEMVAATPAVSVRSKRRYNTSSHQEKKKKIRRTPASSRLEYNQSSPVEHSLVSSSALDSVSYENYKASELLTPCPGVCWDPTHQRWVAHWSDAATRQRIRKYFNPKLLGFSRARLMAILTRKDAVESGRASMMLKTDNRSRGNRTVVKTEEENGVSPTTIALGEDAVVPAGGNVLSPTDQDEAGAGLYFSSADNSWFAHWRHAEVGELSIEAFPLAKYQNSSSAARQAALSFLNAQQ